MRDHRDLDVWKTAMDLVTEVYSRTRDFPKEEVYGLTSQLRRAAVSIPANISEGAARQTDKEFVHFLFIALGSASELETELAIAERLGYLDEMKLLSDQVAAVKKMLNGLIRHYRNKP
jgi:four helix bundle protein